MKELRCIGCKNKLGDDHDSFCSQFDGRRREVMKSNCRIKVPRSNLELIGDNWDNTRALTKITVKEDYHYRNTLDQKDAILKNGIYYISGFWADGMGLSTTLEGARMARNDEFLPAMALKNFYVKKRKIVLDC